MKIEKGIPVSKINIPGAKFLYPWDKMESGDSILVGKAKSRSAVASAYHYAKLHGLRSVSRKEGDGVRIWLFDK